MPTKIINSTERHMQYIALRLIRIEYKIKAQIRVIIENFVMRKGEGVDNINLTAEILTQANFKKICTLFSDLDESIIKNYLKIKD